MSTLFDDCFRTMVSLHDFIGGASCVLAFVAALLFTRFYRKSGDRLFLFFAAAFAIMGINRIALFFADPQNESRSVVLYSVRLLAFALILYAIIDKNRAHRRAR